MWCASAALEKGVATFQERAHAFGSVFAMHHGKQVFEEMFGSLSLAFIPGHAGRLEYVLDTQRGGLGNFFCDLSGLCHLLPSGHDLLHQA